MRKLERKEGRKGRSEGQGGTRIKRKSRGGGIHMYTYTLDGASKESRDILVVAMSLDLTAPLVIYDSSPLPFVR